MRGHFIADQGSIKNQSKFLKKWQN